MLEPLNLTEARRVALAERKPAAPAPPMEELGVTGTTIFGGYLRDSGEYNSKLSGLSAFTTYEEMRRSDAQVAAMLAAIKLPIRGAEWQIAEPENATPVEKEAAEFLREELHESIDFDAALENALLMLDFGVCAHEDVYHVDGNRIRLEKLSPRLPTTFNRWITTPGTDDLVAIEQIGYRGGGYITVELPLTKCSLFTFRQEGANYAGRSILREAYKHWYVKTNLEKVDAIAQERNGMGVPWAEMGPNAKASDIKTAFTFLEQLSTHQKAAIIWPPEWKWGLRGVEGQTKDPKESIRHHNMQIAMAGLSTFLLLGSSESGSRAVGDTLSDFFYMSEQATALRIARVFNLTTVRRLVEMNFGDTRSGGRGGLRMPKLVPQQIVNLKFEGVFNALKELAGGGVGIIQPDEELESWVRKKIGAPEKAEPRVKKNAEPGKTAEDAEDAEETEEPEPKGEREEKAPAKQQMSEGNTFRLPRGPERFLALAEISTKLDQARDEIARRLRAARPRIQAEIVNKLVNTPVRQMHRASLAIDERLVSEVEAVLRDVHEFAVAEVAAELDRQRAGQPAPDASEVRMAEKKPKKSKRDPDDSLGLFADAAVSEFQNTLTQRAANVVLDLTRSNAEKSKGEIIRDADARLDEQADGWVEGTAAKAANEAFAEGRYDGYEENADDIAEVQYSAILDGHTCEECAAAEGETGKTPDDVTPVPNPECLGGDRCRCVHVFVFAGEQRGAA